jgi:hypothetical protein
MAKRSFLIYLMVVAFGLLACTKEEKSPVSGVSPQQEGQKAPSSTGSSLQKSTGNLMVNILPEAPNVMTDLYLVSGGGGKLFYQWQRNGQVINGENSPRLSKNQFVRGDTVAVTVTVDGLEGTASVVVGNSPPKVVSVPFTPEYVHAGTDITVNPIGSDPDGDEVGFHYKWFVNGNELPEDSPVLSGNRFKQGDTIMLTVIPYDRDGGGEPFYSKIMTIPKSPPRITSSPPQNYAGGIYTYNVIAEDPNGDPLLFSLATAPIGMTIDSKTGIIIWQVNEGNVGNHVVEIAVQDPLGIKVTQKYTLSITMKEGQRK